MTSLIGALELVRTKLSAWKGVDVAVRFTRAQNIADLSRTARYYVEPGGVETQRRNVGAPRQIFQVRCVSEQLTTPAEIESAARRDAEFWLDVAYRFVATPRLDATAFVRSANAFPDALAGYNAEALDGGASAVISGLELTLVYD